MNQQSVPTEVTIIRVFDAPRELVFNAWKDCEAVSQWWGPSMFTIPECVIEFHPGGKMNISMQGPDGVVYPGVGAFREIVEPERIVFTSGAFLDGSGLPMLDTLITVVFKDLGGRTELNLHATVLRAAPEVMGALAGMEQGWNMSLDSLASFLSGKGQASEDQSNGNSGMIINAEKRELITSHAFDAPVELVYRVTTDPKLIPQWWGPRGLTTVVDQHDFRVGGTWRYVQRDAQGNEYAFHGEYREIVPNKRLVFTFEYEGLPPGHDLLETILYEEQGGKTVVTTVDVFRTIEDLQGMVQSGMEEGVNDSYERLAELLVEVRKEVM